MCNCALVNCALSFAQLSDNQCSSYIFVRTTTFSTLKLVANLPQILNFTHNSYKELELFKTNLESAGKRLAHNGYPYPSREGQVLTLFHVS